MVPSHIPPAVLRLRALIRQVSDDRVTVYAAQASFFTIISVVPFLSLLIAILSFFIPADLSSLLNTFSLTFEATELLGDLLDQLRDAPKVSLLSFSAITTLWIASKSVAAIRAGIETVYQVRPEHGFFFQRLKSLVVTLVFMLLILASVVVLLFGEFICEILGIVKLTDFIMTLRIPLFILAMCLVFSVMYASAAKRTTRLKTHFLAHMPGAVFASVGWVLFSYFYSLYIRYFPSASYIYGGLTAICLIMLWLYFCMVILLLGAEVNKLFVARSQHRAAGSAEHI